MAKGGALRSWELESEARARSYFARANTSRAQGRLDEAIGLYDAALREKPDYPDALCAGADILRDKGFADAALNFYTKALSLAPDLADAWFNRANLLMKGRRADEALESYDRAAALRPGDARIFCNRGAAFFDVGRLKDALESYKTALRLQPDLAQAAHNMGNALMRLGEFELALAAYDKALTLRKGYSAALCGRGIVLKELGRFDDALASFDAALELDPDSHEALSNRGCLLLQLGRFVEGWDGYEFRWGRDERPINRLMDRFASWRGEPVAGKRILVVNDHAFGDTIQFIRYLPLLRQRGGDVTFLCDKKLHGLAAMTACGTTLVGGVDSNVEFDFQIALSSLPRAFATRLDTIPAQTPYLHADDAAIAKWRERIGGEGFKIGLCWQGNADFRVDPRRSFQLDAMAPLAEIPGVRLISLQKGFGAEQIANSGMAGRVESLGEDFDGGGQAFADTPAVMNALDLIVSCDTSIAHLAGALARPTFVALKPVAEWRWLLERQDSPWYPTMRLFRRGADQDWRGLFEDMALAVGKLAEAR